MSTTVSKAETPKRQKPARKRGHLYRQPGRTIWQMKFYSAGRAVYESTKTDSLEEAEKILAIRLGDVAKGERLTSASTRLTFKDAADDVLNDYKVNGKRSVAHVERRLALHLLPYFGRRRMRAITMPEIRAYIAARLDEDARPATINRELAIIKRAFRLAIQAGHLSARPHVPMLAEQNIRQGFFESTDFANVLAKIAQAPYRDLFELAYLTGWRVPSETLTLTWGENVDEVAQQLRLEPGVTKNDEGRTFPYGTFPQLAALIGRRRAVRDALRKWGIVTQHVFVWQDGKPVRQGYHAIWRAACRAAGVPGRIIHDLRRTAVRNLVRAGVPEAVAMKLTGHKTRSVFDRYDITSAADLRVAVERLSDHLTVTAAVTARPRRKAAGAGHTRKR